MSILIAAGLVSFGLIALWLTTAPPPPARPAFRSPAAQHRPVGHRCGPGCCGTLYRCATCGTATTRVCDGCDAPVCPACTATSDRSAGVYGYDLCAPCATRYPPGTE